MISAQELAAMQSTVGTAFDLTCNIVRPSLVPDGMGGTGTVYTYTSPTYSNVPCNMAQPSQQLLQNYDFLIGALSAWLIGLAIGTDVKPDDHLVVSGQIVQVHTLLYPHSYPTRLHVLCAEIR